MRSALAIATILLLLVAAAAPHTHGGELGAHACLACVTGGCEEAVTATPAVAPPEALEALPSVGHTASPVCGVAIGAVPGQSPPAHS